MYVDVRNSANIKKLFKWLIPVVCDYNIKYQKISGGWVKTQHFITV